MLMLTARVPVVAAPHHPLSQPRSTAKWGSDATRRSTAAAMASVTKPLGRARAMTYVGALLCFALLCFAWHCTRGCASAPRLRHLSPRPSLPSPRRPRTRVQCTMGTFCEDPLTCDHGGVCDPLTGGDTCDCPSEFKGDRCALCNDCRSGINCTVVCSGNGGRAHFCFALSCMRCAWQCSPRGPV
jgi:hypothetical protein